MPLAFSNPAFYLQTFYAVRPLCVLARAPSDLLPTEDNHASHAGGFLRLPPGVVMTNPTMWPPYLRGHLWARALLLAVFGSALWAEQVAQPVVSPIPWFNPTEFNVSITCGTAGASLHYTRDGREPTIADPQVPVSGLVAISGTVVLRVRAWKTGADPSFEVARAFRAGPGIFAGQQHALGVDRAGALWSWGSNAAGQLGTGRPGPWFMPQQVVGLPAVQSAAAGADFSVAVASDGQVWSWGFNSYGQLGNGLTAWEPQPLPAVVGGLSHITSVAAGTASAYAIDNLGHLWGWGQGPIGIGDTVDHPSPTLVTGLPTIIQVAVGNGFVAALDVDGAVWTWGSSYGRLGLGDTIGTSTVPVRVDGVADVIQVAAGNDHTLVLTRDGHIWVWGQGSNGALGLGDTSSRNIPTQVPDLADIVQVAAGARTSYALRRDGTVLAWGWNSEGQVGDGTTTQCNAPVVVAGLAGAEFLAGGSATLALMPDGDVRSCGNNDQLQTGVLGDNQILSPSTAVWTPAARVQRPVILAPLTQALQPVQISITCATASAEIHVTVDGSEPTLTSPVYNASFQVAQTTIVRVGAFAAGMKPSLLAALRVVIGPSFAGGNGHSLAIDRSGCAAAWGQNTYGQLGDGTTTSRATPKRIGDGAVTTGSAGTYHTLLLDAAGAVRSCGGNVTGQLGCDMATTMLNVPTVVAGLPPCRWVCAGNLASYAIDRDGAAWAWGDNSTRQLGDGSLTGSAVPVRVGIPAARAIAALGDLAMAVDTDGILWGWGNGNAVLPTFGSSAGSAVPTALGSLDQVVEVACGQAFAVALRGDVWWLIGFL